MLAVFQVPNKFFGEVGTTDALGQDWNAAWGAAANVRAAEVMTAGE